MKKSMLFTVFCILLFQQSCVVRSQRAELPNELTNDIANNPDLQCRRISADTAVFIAMGYVFIKKYDLSNYHTRVEELENEWKVVFLRIASLKERKNCCKDSPIVFVKKDDGQIARIESGKETIYRLGKTSN